MCPPVIEPDIEQIMKANTSINELEAAVVPADGSSSGVCSAGLAVFALFFCYSVLIIWLGVMS